MGHRGRPRARDARIPKTAPRAGFAAEGPHQRLLQGGTGSGMTGPLEGIVVLDFTRIVAGPFATQILGDLGADVIKVERADGGEEARTYGVTDPSRMPGATFLAMNRNKRSIGIDLQTDAG